MKSQTLVIDLVRNWLPSNDRDDYIHKNLEHFNIVVVSYDADYPGMEKAEVKIIWDRIDSVDQTDRKDVHESIMLTVGKFAHAMGIQINVIRHEGLMTYVSFKNVELKNVESFDWLDIELPPKELQ